MKNVLGICCGILMVIVAVGELQAQTLNPKIISNPSPSSLFSELHDQLDRPDYRQADSFPPTLVNINPVTHRIGIQTRFLVVGNSQEITDQVSRELERVVNQVWNRSRNVETYPYGLGRQLLCYRVHFYVDIKTHVEENFTKEKYEKMLRGEYSSSRHVILAVDRSSSETQINYLYDDQAIQTKLGYDWAEVTRNVHDHSLECAYFGKDIRYDRNCLGQLKSFFNRERSFNSNLNLDLNKISSKNTSRANRAIDSQGIQYLPSFTVYSPYMRSDYKEKVLAHSFGAALGMQQTFNFNLNEANNLTNLGNNLETLETRGDQQNNEVEAFTSGYPLRILHSTLASMLHEVQGIQCTYSLSFNTLWQNPDETCVNGRPRTFGFDEDGDPSGLFVSNFGEFSVDYEYELDRLLISKSLGLIGDVDNHNQNQANISIDPENFSYRYNSSGNAISVVEFDRSTSNGTYPVFILFDDLQNNNDPEVSEYLDGKVIFKFELIKNKNQLTQGITSVEANEYLHGETGQWQDPGITFLNGGYLEEAVFHSLDGNYHSLDDDGISGKSAELYYFLGASPNDPEAFSYLKDTPLASYFGLSSIEGNQLDEAINEFVMGPSYLAQYCHPAGERIYGDSDLLESLPDMLQVSELYQTYEEIIYERMTPSHEYYSLGLPVTTYNVQTSF